MECPFHAGSEAISACVQCETPICPLCATETNQVLLCLNCYRSRVEELSAGLSGASARLAKERKKSEAKLFGRGKRGAAVETTPPEARPAYPTGEAKALWEREEYEPVAAEAAAVPEAAVPEEAPLSRKELARLRKEEKKRQKMEKKMARRAGEEAVAEAAAVPEAAVPEEAPLSRKELARLRKEEKKRQKMEKKLARRAGEEAVAEAAAPPPLETAPFIQPPEATPAEEAPTAPPPPQSKPETAPGPLPDISFEFPLEPEKEGIKLPRLEDRLEFLPPLEEKEEEPPPDLEPPEGFFD